MQLTKSNNIPSPLLIIAIVLIAATSLSIWVWPTLEIADSPANPQALYLLSSIAQALAVIAATVVIASLLIGQVAITQMDAKQAKAADWVCTEFLLLIVSSIVFSLWITASPRALTAKIALNIAAAGIILLLPFLVSLKEKLNVIKHIENMLSQCLSRIKDIDGIPTELEIIDNAAVRACLRKDYRAFEAAVRAIGDIFVAMHEAGKGPGRHSALERLTEIAVLSIDDPRAPIRVVETIETFGQKLAERGSDSLLVHIIRSLRRIGVRASDSKADMTVGRVITTIDSIGAIASQKGLYDTLCEIVVTCEGLAVRSLHHDDDEFAAAAVNCIGRIETTRPATAAKNARSTKKTHADVMSHAAAALERIASLAVTADDSAIAKQAALGVAAIGKAVAEGNVPEEVGEIVIDGLQHIGILSAQNDVNDMFCFSLTALGEIGLTSAENNKSNLVRQVINSAGTVGLKQISEESVGILTKTIGDIGIRADEKGLVETAWAAHILGNVAAKIAQQEDETLRKQVHASLVSIVQTAVDRKLSYCARLMQDAVNRIAVPPLAESKTA